MQKILSYSDLAGGKQKAQLMDSRDISEKIFDNY